MTIITFEAQLSQPEVEDAGCARIHTAEDENMECIFVRIQSWDDDKEHALHKQLDDKRVRITIETID